MPYFSKFPTLAYTLDDGKTTQIIQDIFRRVVMDARNKVKAAFAFRYTVEDGETPETIAYKFYKDTTKHWIILHANEILDARYDWVMSQQDLQKYCVAKYGDGNLYNIHHWQRTEYAGTDAAMDIISDVADPAYPDTISNWEYEDALNEKKRNILVIRKEIIPALDTAISNLIRQ